MEHSLPKSYDDLAAAYLSLNHRFEQLEEYVRFLQRSRFAAKSERLDHPNMKPLFDEPEAPKTPETKEAKETEVKSHTRKYSRKSIPDHLPREDIICDLSEEEKQCPCCQEQMIKTHEKFSEKLNVKPAQYSVKRFITPVYACKGCSEVKQAKLPAHPIPKCGVTIDTLAYIAVSKYLDSLPLYRLEKIFAREGVEISRDKMSRWIVQIGKILCPLKDLLHKKLLDGAYVAMDETSMQVLKEKGRRPDQKGHMFVQAREGPPGKKITIFHYESSRSMPVVSSYLEGFNGSLLTDGLASYQSFSALQPGVSHGGCWAHARRKFHAAVKGKKNNQGIAKTMLGLIKELFVLEKQLEGKSKKEIQNVRTEKSKIVINQIEELWNREILKIPKKSLTGEGLHYLKNQWQYLTCFLKDPQLPIHNNYVERQIKQVVIGRKAWMFADTIEGAEASATLFSLLNTAKENGINPTQYLIKTLEKIESTKILDDLLPLKN